MKEINDVRGKKPTKTEQILEHMVTHPGQVMSPKEVSESLNFNLQTTVTVLNRLSLEGAIYKKGRGLFCYQGGSDTDSKENSGEMQLDKLDIDLETAALIYRTIYNMATESTSANVIGTIAGIGPGDFDEEEPLKSIKKLVTALVELLGEEMVSDMVSIAMDSETIKIKSPKFRELVKQ
jgi:hypothetical protein